MKIIGVETELYPSLNNALKGEERPCSGSTLAEGIAVAEVGDIPLSIIKENVDEVLTVSEAAIERAVAMFALHDKVVAEGAGAAGLAAVLEHPQHFANSKVGLVLCGGNIDSRMLSSVLMRNMVRFGQVITLSIAMPDKPGQLHTVSGICADAGANVLAVEHSRFAMDLAASSARLDITVETKDQAHAEEVIQNIKSSGFHVFVKELTK
jgi:threonine dehydratase